MLEYAQYELNLIKYKNKKEILSLLYLMEEEDTIYTYPYIINAIKNQKHKIKDQMLDKDLDSIRTLIRYLNDKDIEILQKLHLEKPLSAITDIDEEWEKLQNNVYKSNRLNGLYKNGKNGKYFYTKAIQCYNQNKTPFTAGKLYIKHTKNQYFYARLVYPKFNDEFPFIVLEVDDTNDKKWITQSDLDRIQKYYDIEIMVGESK